MSDHYAETAHGQLDRVQEASSSVRALSDLLVYYHYTQEPTKDLADGIHQLFLMCCERLDQSEAAIRCAYNDLAKSDGETVPVTSSVRELRARFVAEKLSEDVDMSEIAQALNMKRAAVEKLASQLAGRETAGKSRVVATSKSGNG
jgi:hypothetical protein